MTSSTVCAQVRAHGGDDSVRAALNDGAVCQDFCLCVGRRQSGWRANAAVVQTAQFPQGNLRPYFLTRYVPGGSQRCIVGQADASFFPKRAAKLRAAPNSPIWDLILNFAFPLPHLLRCLQSDLWIGVHGGRLAAVTGPLLADRLKFVRGEELV